MNKSRLLATSFFAFAATLSIGSALASDCASAPMRSDNGAYQGCEVVHGESVDFRDADSVPEAACPKICEAVSEIDEMAAESRELDLKVGI